MSEPASPDLAKQALPSQARVVVIGGGIMGCSLLYHLAKEGWTDCLLIEKAELTSGSTWHAAGQITHSLGNFAIAKMAGYGIELYQSLEEETGQSVTFHRCGSLRVAYTDDEVDFLHQIVSIGATLGHPMEIVGPQRIAELHPFYKLDGIQAALHTPADGHVDPAGASFALAKGARLMGAKVVRQTRVTDVQQAAGGEWLVVTDKGTVTCEHVVNAAGTYARQVGEWSGLDLPVVSATHHYLVTDTVPEFQERDDELPVVRDDHVVSGYVRQEQKSGLIGIYEKADPRPIWTEGTPWEAEHELFEPDYDRIMPWLEAALDRVPVLAELGIKRVVHGAIAHPPDGLMMLGPAPGLRNYWCACGIPVGIAWGPGAGKALAQWMVHGSAEINMRAFDPRRYGPFATLDYAVEKVKEDYILRHETPYPHRDRPACRPVKASPLYQRLKDEGAVFEQIFGWERAFWFARDGLAQEHQESFRRSAAFTMVAGETKAVRERVGLMDLSAFAKLDVSGRDAEALLDRLVANRLPRKVGGIALTHMLNAKGTIEAEVTVTRIAEDRFFLLFAAFSELRVRDWIEQNKHPEAEVSVDNLSETHGCLVLSGPAAREVLRQVTQAPLDNEHFPWLTAQTIEVAGAEVRALRVSYVGELGWELYVPMAHMPAVYDALMQAGEPHGIAPFGSAALNAMRLEKGFKGASELTNEVTLPEADVMRFAKLDKGEFLGKAATEASLAGDLPWRCAYLAIEAADSDCHGAEAVFSNGSKVGAISSGGYGHHVGQSLAFAYLDPAYADPGTDLEVMVLGQRRPAKVLGEALYDPKNERPRA